MDTQLTEKEKKEKLQPIEERRRKLKKILTDDQINKADEVTKEVNSMRGQKQISKLAD